ncbi:MAG TPA: response regulator, partial [Candidatus Limnocylindrales bacterium]|nr:response regulator [Candidatus Limnocylindrales bacterium]
SAPPGPCTVLLVEDNPTDVFVIREAIEASGLDLKIRIAGDGQEALWYLQDLAGNENVSCPALVLLDLNLPKVDGIEVLRQLRGGSRCSRTPVVVVTSSTAEEDRAAVLRLGAESYFQKPNTLAAYKELAQVIKRLLRPSEETHQS